MSAAAVMAAGPSGGVREFWGRFRERLLVVVRECNCEAGETLWTAEDDAVAPSRLRIRGAAGVLAELELDTAHARLSCNFPGSSAGRWRFQLAGDGTTLRRAATTYGIAESVNAILDRMVRM